MAKAKPPAPAPQSQQPVTASLASTAKRVEAERAAHNAAVRKLAQVNRAGLNTANEQPRVKR